MLSQDSFKSFKMTSLVLKMDNREYLRKLVKYVPRRLRKVIRRKGTTPGISWRNNTPN
jgi:hypothetical protein